MSAVNHQVINALSFDIEDWFHLMEVEEVSDPRKWPSLPSLVERETDRIIGILSAADVRGTFFVLGWVARRYPKLVRRISDAGHELASHSYWHRRVDRLAPHEFKDDLRESIDVTEQAGGQKVRGFRAPSFSITPGAEWAFDVMHELGLSYDASLFPARRGHGGYPCPQHPHLFQVTPSGRQMPELPMSVWRKGPLKVPFSGGGYLRALPLSLIHHGFAHFHRQRLPVVVYLHPRDFAPDTPRIPMPLQRRFKCYVGLHTTCSKLHSLLDHYRWDTCATVLETVLRGGVMPSIETDSKGAIR
jgi:polysaccharide deacetylase family protein (PEP-CTERM system associated)